MVDLLVCQVSGEHIFALVFSEEIHATIIDFPLVFNLEPRSPTARRRGDLVRVRLRACVLAARPGIRTLLLLRMSEKVFLREDMQTTMDFDSTVEPR